MKEEVFGFRLDAEVYTVNWGSSVTSSEKVSNVEASLIVLNLFITGGIFNQVKVLNTSAAPGKSTMKDAY